MINNINISSLPHFPVMLKEVLKGLNIEAGKTYLDCTFGAGGYSRAILQATDCKLYALDQDPNVNIFVEQLKKDFPSRFRFYRTNFADAAGATADMIFDGIVLDLGVSSMQIDQDKRGFSFMKDGPLDMRMSGRGLSAEEFINTASEQELADVIYKYGDEVQSRAIAKNIAKHRESEKITATLRFAEIVREAMHYSKSKIDPVTKTFQAIRIHINGELRALEKLLESSRDMLAPGGRIAVVSFHSLEDSIVKNFFKKHSAPKIAQSKYSREVRKLQEGEWLKLITKKPIAPTSEEIRKNIRSRSAKLRIAEKAGGNHVA